MAILVYGSGGGSGNDISDTTAIQSDVLPGKYFYLADGTKVEGSMATKAAATIVPSTSDQTINANQYLLGAQTIQGSANLKAENIKKGVSMFGVTGSHLYSQHSGNATVGANNRLTLSGYNFTPYGVIIGIRDIGSKNSTVCAHAGTTGTSALVAGDSLSGMAFSINSSWAIEEQTIWGSGSVKIYSASSSSITIYSPDNYLKAGNVYAVFLFGL
jgi:hypothetical protein